MSVIIYPKDQKKLEELEKSLALGKEVRIHPNDISGYVVLREILKIEAYKISEDVFKELENLPLYLMKTLKAVITLGGSASAIQIANYTKRNYARESGYLNDLYRLGFLEKKKKGRKIFFTISSKYNLQELKNVIVNWPYI
jgi:hypothetical protein